MERLTEKVFGFVQLKACGNDFCKETCAEHDEEKSCENCHIQKAFEKLAEYEDLDEQGLLLRLSTEAYFIKNNNVCKGWVQEVVYSPCRKLLIDVRYDDNSLDSYRGYVGNTVFLTQAEAEQKLKEMKGV